MILAMQKKDDEKTRLYAAISCSSKKNKFTAESPYTEKTKSKLRSSTYTQGRTQGVP
jgi:hypothetical protein